MTTISFICEFDPEDKKTLLDNGWELVDFTRLKKASEDPKDTLKQVEDLLGVPASSHGFVFEIESNGKKIWLSDHDTDLYMAGAYDEED